MKEKEVKMNSNLHSKFQGLPSNLEKANIWWGLLDIVRQLELVNRFFASDDIVNRTSADIQYMYQQMNLH